MKLRFLLIPCLALLSGGCFLQKKPTVAVPVVPAPAPQTAPPPAPVAAKPQPAPTSPATATPPGPVPANDTGKRSPFPPAPATPKPAPATTIRPPAPAPALGAVLTADQRTQLNIAYLADLRQANAVLTGLKGRSLTKDQADTVARARAFIAQAGQYHDRDLTTAAELARRARVLTQDLAGTLK